MDGISYQLFYSLNDKDNISNSNIYLIFSFFQVIETKTLEQQDNEKGSS